VLIKINEIEVFNRYEIVSALNYILSWIKDRKVRDAPLAGS
jgi:hypothetical protein